MVMIVVQMFIQNTIDCLKLQISNNAQFNYQVEVRG